MSTSILAAVLLACVTGPSINPSIHVWGARPPPGGRPRRAPVHARARPPRPALLALRHRRRAPVTALDAGRLRVEPGEGGDGRGLSGRRRPPAPALRPAIVAPANLKGGGLGPARGAATWAAPEPPSVATRPHTPGPVTALGAPLHATPKLPPPLVVGCLLWPNTRARRRPAFQGHAAARIRQATPPTAAPALSPRAGSDRPPMVGASTPIRGVTEQQ